MPNRTTNPTDVINEMMTKMQEMTEKLSEWVTNEPQTLEAIEKQVLGHIRALGASLVAGLCSLSAPRYADTERPCPHCGEQAFLQRHRQVHVTTVLGDIRYTRPYYLCPQCHQGHAPLDDSLGACPGGISDGLHELCAFAGVREAFAEASDLLARLTLITVSPNTIRSAAESVGAGIIAAEHESVTQAFAVSSPELPTPPTTLPERLYVSMDGNMVNTREDHWKENKLGAVYTTTTTPSKKRPDTLDIRARDITFVTDFTDPETFGREVWLEACRRGGTMVSEIVAIGDGAPWIWNQIAEHFPDAIQILDWYHVTEYLWDAAHAIYGRDTDLSKQWAKQQLDQLWEGQVDAVLRALAEHASKGEAVTNAIRYYTNNQSRMDYARYRDLGLQVGSGTIESGCKHVIAHRLKQAGMIWNLESARAMAKARAWMKSGRWEEAMALRPNRRRSYHRSEDVASSSGDPDSSPPAVAA